MATEATAPGPVSAAPEMVHSSWAIVVAFAAVVACTQMLWLTFAPIDTDVARDFGVSKNAIGWLAQVFPLLYVVLALPAGLALDRWFRGTLAGGAALTAFGSLVRLVSATFAWALARTAVDCRGSAIRAQRPDEDGHRIPASGSRPNGIAVASAAQFLGAVVALAMGPLLEHTHNLGPLLPVQAAIACVSAVVLILLLHRTPADEGPPAAIGLAEAKAVWGVSLVRRLAWLAFVGVGVFVALSTWLQPILHNDHISSTAAGTMLAGMLISGTIGCGIVPPIVARHHVERRYLTFAIVWVAACCRLLAIVHPSRLADYIVIAGLGFVLLAALPVMLELIERRMGASGGTATGILLLIGNLGGLLVAIVVGALVNTAVAAFLVLGLVAFAGLPAARRVVEVPARQH